MTAIINNNRSEYFKEYNKKYYQDKVDKLKMKINCECGGSYTYVNKTHHLNTKRHQNMIKQTMIYAIDTKKMDMIKILLNEILK